MRTGPKGRIARLLFLIVALSVLTDCNRPMTNEAQFKELLTAQGERYPRMQAQDLYKFIHQAAMGSEHAVSDTAAARAWLEEELGSLASATTPEPVADSLSPDGQLVRINLRPFLQIGGDPEALLKAFIRTANEYEGSTALLERYWSWAEELATDGKLPVSIEDLHTFFTEMGSMNFPAVHHSEAYEAAYHPAYRVIVHDYLVMSSAR